MLSLFYTKTQCVWNCLITGIFHWKPWVLWTVWVFHNIGSLDSWFPWLRTDWHDWLRTSFHKVEKSLQHHYSEDCDSVSFTSVSQLLSHILATHMLYPGYTHISNMLYPGYTHSTNMLYPGYTHSTNSWFGSSYVPTCYRSVILLLASTVPGHLSILQYLQ